MLLLNSQIPFQIHHLKSTYKLSFYRLPSSNGPNQATIYNAWYTRNNVMTMINSGINNSTWLTNGNLQNTRTFLDTSTNTYDNAMTYTAIHGNGYGSTNVESERLSPCVGYWNYTPGSGSSSTGGGGQQSGGGGGSSTNTNCSVTVIARIPDGKGWVSSTDTLGFETDSGHSYYFTEAWSDNGNKKDSSGTNYYPFSGGTQTWTVPNSSEWRITYTLTNQDYWGHN